jgi:hypothetical protein
MFQFFQKSLVICLFMLFIFPEAVVTSKAQEEETKNQTSPKADKEKKKRIFAKVGDTVITMADYQFAFVRAAQEKFYHGKPAQGKIAELQREVGQDLVDRVFLREEAKRRGIVPDAADIDERMRILDEKNSTNPRWEANREKLIPIFKAYFEEKNILKKLEKQVRDSVPEPSDAEIREFYEKNPQLFTEPEKIRIWVILLKVDPSAKRMVWEDTRHNAMKLISRLDKGEDFSGLAREFSNDKTAAKGGDMGFVHGGVLVDVAQKAVDKLAPGEYAREPILLLEGFAIFKRGGTILPKHHEYEKVKERAKQILMREVKKAAWENLKAEFRKSAPVEVNDDFYLPLKAGEKQEEAVKEYE